VNSQTRINAACWSNWSMRPKSRCTRLKFASLTTATLALAH
jgi:hypothetical protein